MSFSSSKPAVAPRADPKWIGTTLLRIGALLAPASLVDAVHGFEINQHLSIGSILAGGMQCQRITDAAGYDNGCKGATIVQPELSYRPTRFDELHTKFGFAIGNGLNGNAPFTVAPWSADLEHDVKNINGHSHDHLLTAWYRHEFRSDTQQIGVTFGVIDATDYLDNNRYANDEYHQFMNAVMTNGPNVFLPSYDLGAAVEWQFDHWSLHAVAMEVGENDDGKAYRFYGLQIARGIHSRYGEGNYRMILAAGSRDFLHHSGAHTENRHGVLFSFDQQFGAVLGAWARFGWQSDQAAVEHNAIYSAGIELDGAAWGRGVDRLGLGFARLDGGSLDIARSWVVEGYYRWQLNTTLSLSADLQYLNDTRKDGRSPRGWIAGLRAVAEF